MKRLALLALMVFALFPNTKASAQNTSAGLTPCGLGTSLSVTTSSANAQLQACGGVAVVWNIGTNEVFLALGTTSAATATTSGWSLPAGTAITLNVGTNRPWLAAISSSTSTLRVVQGTGAPYPAGGSGGGGGGGGGGAVTIADGADVTQGAQADAACATDNGVCTVVALIKRNNILSDSALPAGTNVIGGITTADCGSVTLGCVADAAWALTGSGTVVSVIKEIALLGNTPTPCFAATTATTNSYTNGQVSPPASINCNLNGNLYVSVVNSTLAVTQSGTWSTRTQDGSGTAITSTGAALDVNIKSGGATSTTNAPVAPASATATNSTLLGVQYNSTQATFTNGQQGALQVSSRGEAKTNVMDAAGNARGANVTAGNALQTDMTTIAGTATATGSGVLGAGTQRVALATDSPGIVPLGAAAAAASVPVIPASQYPGAAVPINGIGTGSTGAVTGTLAGTSGKTTYICGFDISSLGTAGSPGPVVVSGLVSGSFTYQFSTLSTGVASNFGRTFSPCLPASATNTAIVTTTTANATGTAVDVNSWGFQL